MNKMNYQEIVDDLPISRLVNTQESPFWYVREGTNRFARRYIHEDGRKGDIFYDGNNGDRWKVLAINQNLHRMVVTNLTQHGTRLVYWD